MLAEVRAREREQSRTVPNNVKKRIDELRAKKAALLNDFKLLGISPTALRDDGDEGGEVTHVRAARSSQLDPNKHKSQNKEATQRYRKRLAEEEELMEAITNLETQKSTALRSRALPRRESSAMAEDLLTLAVTMNSRLHAMALEIVGMASDRLGGIVIVNVLRQPSCDIALSNIIASSPNASTIAIPYTYGTLRSIFGDVSSENEGAAIISFFDEYTGAFHPKVYAHGVTLPNTTPEQPVYALQDWGSRHVAAYATSQMTNAPIVIVSHKSGTVTFVHRGYIWSSVTFEMLSQKLLNVLDEEYRQQCVSSWVDVLFQAERFITTRCEIKLFNEHLHSDWYENYYVDTHMQWHRSAGRDVVLTYLAQRTKYPFFIDYINADGLPPSVSPDTTTPGRQAVGYILEYGHQRLGGLFLRFNEQRKAILAGNPFIRLDLLYTCYTLRFLAALIKFHNYTRWYERFDCFFPPYLVKSFEPLIVAVDLKRTDDLAFFYGMDPTLNIGYSCPLGNILRLLV